LPVTKLLAYLDADVVLIADDLHATLVVPAGVVDGAVL
jgi:hypothetical protein